MDKILEVVLDIQANQNTMFEKVFNTLDKHSVMLQETQKKITSMQEEFTAMREDVAVLKKDIAALKKDVAALKKDVAALKKDVAALKKDVAGMQKEITVLKEDVAGIKEEMISMRVLQNIIFERLDKLEEKVDRLYDLRKTDRSNLAKVVNFCRSLSREITELRGELNELKAG